MMKLLILIIMAIVVIAVEETKEETHYVYISTTLSQNILSMIGYSSMAFFILGTLASESYPLLMIPLILGVFYNGAFLWTTLYACSMYAVYVYWSYDD